MLDLLAGFVVLLMVAPPLLITAGGLLLFLAGISPRTPHRARTGFRCRWAGRLVTADFLVPAGAAHPSLVVSCTAFRNPERVTCKQPCRELADIRWDISRGLFPGWALTAGGVVKRDEMPPGVVAGS